MDFPFKSTKTFVQAFPVAYRQWRADSHCNQNHGYALTIHLEFGGFDLDARNWLVDFGGLRGLKGELEDLFDHAQLVSQDDPELEFYREMGRRKIAKITEVERTGCEGLSDFIFEHLNDGWLKINGYGDRVICTKVEVRETDANMAMRCLSLDDYHRFCGQILPTPSKGLKWIRGGRVFNLMDERTIVWGTVYPHSPGFSTVAPEYEGGKIHLLARDAAAEVLKAQAANINLRDYELELRSKQNGPNLLRNGVGLSRLGPT